ncbi:CIC11C00000003543 [Sungouiella intermedia]|uniref:CIC11C00000003543 n=1 Tax=Sungouiella intermedia TaxID=45354 RepID=A0A1L0DNM4_9ASCO|nr:CIC11C00000003543 [[Candida] intermedia]
MAGFPKVPLIRGDTDDDASIHLHTHVGPARPLSKRNYDRQIIDILNRGPLRSSSDEDLLLELDDLNAQFEHYSKHRRPSFYSDGEETEVEDAPDKVHTGERESLKRRPAPKSSIKSWLEADLGLWIVGFVVGNLLLVLIPFLLRKFTNQVVPDLSSVSKRIDLIGNKVDVLDDITQALSNQADSLESKQRAFITSITHKIDTISQRFESVNEEIGTSILESLQGEIDAYKKKVDTMEVLFSDSEKLEADLAVVSHKLSQLSTISEDFNAFKNDIISSLASELPSHVPVYIKDNKIHYLPEFQSFLHAFIEKFMAKKGSSSDFADHSSKLDMMVKKQVSKDLGDTVASLVSKEELMSILNKRLNETNEALMTKLNSILDEIDLSGNISRIDVAHATNKVMLDNLVDIVSKGSVKMNFADYKNGARILGFLTSTGRDSYKQKSVIRRIFLGWYDYFDSHGLRSPQNLKYNANNLLKDMGSYWVCETNRCNFGVRLSSPVILTDFIFKNPSQSNLGISLPTRASIYIKPSKKSQVALIENCLKRTKPEFLAAGKDNKYLTKFFKIQEVALDTKPVQHIKLPVSLVNQKILAKDIYIELSSRDGCTGLYNLKVYGLTEFNSLAYAEQFESILDNLHDEPGSQNHYSFEYGQELGDDEYY